MTPVMIALLLTLWAVLGEGTTGMSTHMANFMIVTNGHFDNLAQYQADNRSHNYIELRCRPVTTPALPGPVALFSEWAVNGEVVGLFLSDTSEDSNGVIYLVVYNISDPSQYKPGQYKVDDLSKLKPEDVNRPPTCEAAYEPAGVGTFVGTWPDCRHYVKGGPGMYAGTLTCNVFEIVIPRSATEMSSRLPYNLVRKGDRFKVPDLPKDFVNPCS